MNKQLAERYKYVSRDGSVFYIFDNDGLQAFADRIEAIQREKDAKLCDDNQILVLDKAYAYKCDLSSEIRRGDV